MASTETRPIEAAGGVLWRSAPGPVGVEVCLVHRPKYDDWSLPKGKLGSDEHPLLGALREVEEETGFAAHPGRPLGEIRYLKDGLPKRVRYWACEVVGGRFESSLEVDQLMWLPPREGQLHLLPERDRTILAGYAEDTRPTWPIILVRHGSAGERGGWTGDDRDRPLDGTGRSQAHALTPLLSAFGVTRVLSADVARCLETVAPYAREFRHTVTSEPLVSESGYAMAPGPALDRMVEVCATAEATVVCSQGKAIPGLITGLAERLGAPAPDEATLRKGGFWVLHVAAGPDLVAMERFPPPL
ncbi:MAG TPA: bifunctional NUDIX hydrolase/histidine phosphatase family protein [Mycobacteriales bacterium]|nr:bifunctional NUDIX hydrolase/histidine phosphatase family protein [Mycobacteriales bacterium]